MCMRIYFAYPGIGGGRGEGSWHKGASGGCTGGLSTTLKIGILDRQVWETRCFAWPKREYHSELVGQPYIQTKAEMTSFRLNIGFTG